MTINQFHSVIGCASTIPLCIMIAKVCLLSARPRQICYCYKLVFCDYCWKVCRIWQCFGSVVVDCYHHCGILNVVRYYMFILVLQSS